MNERHGTAGHADALARLFPWATWLTEAQRLQFARELELDTSGWSAEVVRAHTQLVIAHWERRAVSGHESGMTTPEAD
jgi:hypothetical protein